MDAKKRKAEIISSALETIEYSSFHGLTNIIKNKFMPIKIMWVFCLLCSTIGCIYLLVQNVVQYLEYEVDSQILISSELSLTFPTVKICSLALQTNFSDEYEMPSNLWVEMNYLYDLAVQWHEKSDAIRKAIGFSLEQNVISCVFSGAECNMTNDFSYFYDNLHGNCYVFNSGTDMYGNSVAIKSSSTPGSINGLILEIYIGAARDNNALYSYQHGVNVLVDDTVYDSTQSGGVLVSPGLFTNLVVSRTLTSQVPKPYSDCTDNLVSADSYPSECYKRTIETSGRSYRQLDCQAMCLAKYVGDECGCEPPFYSSFYPNMRYCLNTTDLQCNELRYATFAQDANIYAQCDCPIECSDVSYQVTNSASQFPTKFYAQVLANNSLIKSKFSNSSISYDDLSESVASVAVFYDVLQQTEINHEVKMSSTDLIAAVGGLLGLFLGASFLSMVEFLEILMQTLIIFFRGKVLIQVMQSPNKMLK